MSKVMINRRVVLGSSVFVVSAFSLIGCLDEKSRVNVITSNGDFFNAKELTTLTDIAEIMIPQTDTAGATQAQVAAVIDSLMLSWAGKDTKAQFQRELAAYDSRAKLSYGQQYLKLAPEDRYALFAALDEAAFSDAKPDTSADYRRLKEVIFHVFYTSEEANPDYAPIPGQYDGDLSFEDYTKLTKENSYGR